MSYAREPEEALGASPGIQATGFKAITTSMVPKSTVASQLTATAPAPGGGSAIGMGLLVVGLGLGGFLLYRHFKKKQAGSAPTP